MGRRHLVALGLGAAVLGGPVRGARADEADEASRKLVDLEQQVRNLNQNLRDQPPPPPDLAERRVLDGQALFGLKHYEEASTLFLDVVDKWPNSRAAQDAVFLLGESLFQMRDYLSARRYLVIAVGKNVGGKPEQEALQRLIEISLRTGDFGDVDEYLGKLDRVPPSAMEPSVPYVKGKYLFFRKRYDDAANVFNAIPSASPYYVAARYFYASALVARACPGREVEAKIGDERAACNDGDLGSASVAFDAVTKMQAADEATREIQDLARMALGRIHYDRAHFDDAIVYYNAVARQSKYFPDALFEMAWTHIKAKNFLNAYRSLDLNLLMNPDGTQAPELRLLMGNLNLRLGNFFLASDAFSKTRDEFEPIHRQLRGIVDRSTTDPEYFNKLVGSNLDKFDISVFIPPAAAKWVRAEPGVARMLSLASDVSDLQKALKETNATLDRIERAVNGLGKVGIFPDLASARAKATSVLNQVVEIRQRFVRKLRSTLQSKLNVDEAKELDQIAAERDGLERQLQNLPKDEGQMEARTKQAEADFDGVDGRLSELNVELQSMEAQLVAVEQYFRNSSSEQKIKPEDLQGPARDMHEAIDDLRAQHDKLRDEVADAKHDATKSGATAEAERATTARLVELLQKEQELQAKVRGRLSGNEQRDVDRMNEVLGRVDGVQTLLLQFDKRVEDQAELRLKDIRVRLAEEKTNLVDAGQGLGFVVSESKTLGGGLAQTMFAKVADRFYDLVVRSDVGIIDVAWGLKDQKTTQVSKLINQQKLELKAMDEDFKALEDEDKEPAKK